MTDTLQTTPGADFDPTAREVARVVAAIRDDQLDGPTPCPGTTVGALMQHLLGLCAAFTAAAGKQSGPATDTPPAPADGVLEAGWRELAPQRLADLARAWRDPAAWQGQTRAGGVDLPAAVAGAVALDEVLVHGWDLAVATGQRPAYDDEALHVALSVVGAPRDPAEDDGTLFGPPVPVADDAPLLDRVIALSGRDPRWAPPHLS